jgi:hypothetical protein
MNLKGYSINIDRTDNGTKCLTATTHNQMRIYYFDDYNNCVRYVYTIEGATYKILEDAHLYYNFMSDKGFRRTRGGRCNSLCFKNVSIISGTNS